MADNANDQHQADPQKPAKPARRIGWGYLVIALLAVGVLVLFVLAPELPRQWLGSTPPKPNGPGDEPVAAGEVAGGALAAKDVDTELALLGRVSTLNAPPAAPQKPVDTGAPVKPADGGYADESKAAPLLAEAERLYRAMDWDKAESAASRAVALNAQPSTRGRAAEIARGAPALKRLFRDLDDRDELTRNFDTHPSLLRLNMAGRESLGVPLLSMDDPATPVLENPLGWVDKLRKAGRKGIFMVKGAKQFSKAELDLTSVEATEVDQAAQRRDLLATLDRKLMELKGDKEAQRNPMVFYEAGKFAYRNRLDDRVTALLDRALILDPFLNRTVREANAGTLFGSMVVHMKNGNKQQAAAFMNAIDRRYKDTDQGRQARLFYDGKSAELLAAAKEAERQAKEEEEARRKARIAAERAKGDEVAAKQIEQEKPEEEPAAPVAANVPADLAGARQAYTDGAKIVAEAMNMPATDARNKKYHDAAKILAKAKAAFSAYCEKNPADTAVAEELVACAKAHFAAVKYATAF